MHAREAGIHWTAPAVDLYGGGAAPLETGSRVQNYSDLRDEQLITLIAHGEKDALEALYERFTSTIFSMARYMLRDQHQAEEITQEIFLNVWRKAGNYDPRRGTPRTWLMSVAHNRIIDEIRSKRRLSQSSEQTPHEILDSLPSHRPTTEEEAHQNLTRGEILAALDTIPKEQREVIVLAYFGGFSQSEIAERLSQPLGTVKTRTRLGLQKLRGALRFSDGE